MQNFANFPRPSSGMPQPTMQQMAQPVTQPNGAQIRMQGGSAPPMQNAGMTSQMQNLMSAPRLPSSAVLPSPGPGNHFGNNSLYRSNPQLPTPGMQQQQQQQQSLYSSYGPQSQGSAPPLQNGSLYNSASSLASAKQPSLYASIGSAPAFQFQTVGGTKPAQSAPVDNNNPSEPLPSCLAVLHLLHLTSVGVCS
jgi:hypothetical protein